MWKHTQKTENQKFRSTNLMLRPEIKTIKARREKTNILVLVLIAANLCLTNLCNFYWLFFRA